MFNPFACGIITTMKRNVGEAVFVEKWGYMMVVAPPNHPHARCKGTGSGIKGGSRGYIRRSRYIVECYIGRYLTPNEPVHHINGDKLDDRIENLQVMTHSEHSRLHWFNPRRKPGLPERGQPCRRCHVTLTAPWGGKRGFCNACYLRAKRLRVNGVWPEWAEYPKV